MFGEIIDYFDKEIEAAVVVKNAFDQKLLVDVLNKYIKHYTMEISKIEDSEATIIVLKLRQNRYNTLIKSLHDYDYNILQISSSLNIVKLAHYIN